MTTATHTTHQKSLLLPQYQNVTVKPRARDYLVDGERFQRVSTIINIIAKPALVPWAVKETVNKLQETLMEEETRVILNELSISHGPRYQEWVNQLAGIAKSASDKKRDEAADRGTRIHAEIQAALQNGTSVDSVWLTPPARSALQWFYSNGYNLKTTEMVLWGPSWNVAGTCDVVADDADDALTILDWKTGSSIYPESAIQIAAYASMYAQLTGRPPLNGCVVHVTEDGCKPYYIKNLPEAVAAFQNALDLLRYVRNEKEVWA